MKRDLKALIVLFKAQQTILNNVKLTLENASINLNEFMVLEALNTKGCLTTYEITKACLIPNSSLTYVLDNLEKKTMIKRSKNPDDRRVQKLELTEYGKKHFAAIYESHFTHMRSIFDVLNDTEEHVLIETLKKLGKEAERNLI